MLYEIKGLNIGARLPARAAPTFSKIKTFINQSDLQARI
jgi:hypothetical protein